MKYETKNELRKIKEAIIAVFAIFIIVSLVIFVYRSETKRKNTQLAKRIAELSPKGGPPETIEGLRRAIELYEEQIERNVAEGAQTGAYWKILAIRLADRNMHNDALSAFERAIYFNSEDPTLFYLTGVSAASVGKSKVGFSPDVQRERDHFYNLAERSYLRAIELDNIYTRPMYGLAVLYVFELGKYQEAIPYLDRLLSIQTGDINAMAILARANFLLGRYNQAIEMYERIISRSRDKNIQAEALNNIEIIQRRLYE